MPPLLSRYIIEGPSRYSEPRRVLDRMVSVEERGVRRRDMDHDFGPAFFNVSRRARDEFQEFYEKMRRFGFALEVTVPRRELDVWGVRIEYAGLIRVIRFTEQHFHEMFRDERSFEEFADRILREASTLMMSAVVMAPGERYEQPRFTGRDSWFFDEVRPRPRRREPMTVGGNALQYAATQTIKMRKDSGGPTAEELEANYRV